MKKSRIVGEYSDQPIVYEGPSYLSCVAVKYIAVLLLLACTIGFGAGCQSNVEPSRPGVSTLGDEVGNGSGGSIPISDPGLVAVMLSVDSSAITINSALEYQVTGQLSDGSIVALNLDEVLFIGAEDDGPLNKVSDQIVGVSYGSTNLQASYQGISSQAVVVTVVPVAATLESITLTNSSLELELGDTSDFSVWGEFTDGTMINLTETASWTISDPSVIEISSAGIFYAIGVGASQVVANFEGLATAPIVFDVLAPELPLFDASAKTSLVLSTQDHQYLSGQVGGPFAAQQAAITLHNVGNQSLTWRGYATSEWLDLNIRTGVIPAGQSVLVVATVNSSANALSAGEYYAQLCFVNMSDTGGGGVAPIVFQVGTVSAGASPVYYVDFDGGLDGNSGLSIASPWKHAPGDPAATGLAGSANLTAGSKVIFKGGVHYRGTITAPQSGVSGSNIIFDGNSAGGFGEGKAILNGSEPLTNWTPASANTYTTTIPAEGYDDLFSVNLCTDERIMTLAQGPLTPSNPVQFDDIYNYFVSLPPSAVTTSSITDPDNLSGLPADFWVGGYIAIWAVPNIVYVKALTGYNPSTATVSFEAVNAVYTDRNTPYSILNCAVFMDQPGEYVVNESAMTLTFLPEATADLTDGSITSSVRNVGFDFGGRSFVTVQGFRMLKFSAGLNRWYLGCGVRNRSAVEGIEVLNNEVGLCRSMARAGALTVTDATNSLVSGNYIHKNFKNRGVLSLASDNLTLSYNVLYANGGTGLCLFSLVNSTVTQNAILNHMGTHSNCITFYVNCANINVTWNEVYGGLNALTTLTATNILFAHNVFSVSPTFTSYTVADWGNSANLQFYNNVFESPTSRGFWLSSTSLNGAKLKNNIMDGNLMSVGSIDASNNIYTSLAWNQNANALAANEFTVFDKLLLFVNPLLYDFRVAESSPAIDQGVDVGDTSGEVIGVVDIGVYEN